MRGETEIVTSFFLPFPFGVERYPVFQTLFRFLFFEEAHSAHGPMRCRCDVSDGAMRSRLLETLVRLTV